jgi:succinoglycan biosynthesis protein ExoV
MEIIYWKSSIQNFGDEFNKDFWNKCLDSEILSSHVDEAILGIGSILHFDVGSYQKIHVMGSGTSKEKLKLNNKDSYQFWFVRGPLTAKVLGLDSSLGISDPAILVPDLYKMDLSDCKKKFKTYIPHYASAINANLKWACDLIGFEYLAPTDSLENIVKTIVSSELVVTESLHGAIIADAYGIPWVPASSPFISRAAFKWQDWCLTIGRTYDPLILPKLTSRHCSSGKLFLNSVRYGMSSLNLGPERWLDKQTKIHGEKDLIIFSQALVNGVKEKYPNFSSPLVIASLQERIYQKISDFGKYMRSRL